MSLSMAAKQLAFSWEITKINILAAMEYRAAFWMQVIGMLINDIGLLLGWYVVFLSFPEINGWRFPDIIILFAIATSHFALGQLLAGGVQNLARTIANGQLDYFLAFPKPVLWHVLISNTNISALGDLLFGIGIFFLFCSPTFTNTITFFFVVIVTAVIYVNILIILGSLAFYVKSFEEISSQYGAILLGFAFIPPTVFWGTIKILMVTILPAYFLFALPAELIRQWNWYSAIELLLFTIITFILARLIFAFGLKKYESGNLINVKM